MEKPTGFTKMTGPLEIQWAYNQYGSSLFCLLVFCLLTWHLTVSLPRKGSEGNSWVRVCEIGLVLQVGWNSFTDCRLWSRERLVSLNHIGHTHFLNLLFLLFSTAIYFYWKYILYYTNKWVDLLRNTSQRDHYIKKETLIQHLHKSSLS